MVVIESGGTKSTWVFHDISGQQKSITTVGLHPRELSSEKATLIASLISEHQLGNKSVYFFGAGCESTEAKAEITDFLKNFELQVKQVETDVYAACIAHLGNREGVVGILGTGAVAAQFDGQKIIRQTSGLGYMLGDEGSGFDIGKRMLQAYFRNNLTPELNQAIKDYFSGKSILHRIYAPDGRKIVAGLTKIAFKYRELVEVQKVLSEAFADFYHTAIQPLGNIKKVFMIGSVAFFFQEELSKSLQLKGCSVSAVEKEAVFKAYRYLSQT